MKTNGIVASVKSPTAIAVRPRVVEHPAPVHRFIDTWLRVHASSPRWIHRSELVDAVQRAVASGAYEGMGWLRDARDLDREVRALCQECSDLGFPVVTGPNGYCSADPADPGPWRVADLQDLKRIHALRRRIRRRRWSRDAESRRRSGERAIVQTKMTTMIPEPMIPARGQGSLFR